MSSMVLVIMTILGLSIGIVGAIMEWSTYRIVLTSAYLAIVTCAILDMAGAFK